MVGHRYVFDCVAVPAHCSSSYDLHFALHLLMSEEELSFEPQGT